MATFLSGLGISNSFQDSVDSIHLQVPIVHKVASSITDIINTFLNQKQSNHTKIVLETKKHSGGIDLPLLITPTVNAPVVPQRRVLGVLLFKSKK